jgi:hypothetical protein
VLQGQADLGQNGRLWSWWSRAVDQAVDHDKAGTVWNMIRFASPRATKRNQVPVRDYRYPHHQA